jgi:hypothetical protein
MLMCSIPKSSMSCVRIQVSSRDSSPAQISSETSKRDTGKAPGEGERSPLLSYLASKDPELTKPQQQKRGSLPHILV